MKYDIILSKGRVVDFYNDIDGIYDLGIKDGKIIKVKKNLNHHLATQVLDLKDKIVVPGIIDSHVHILRPDSKAAGYRMLIRAGVTTAIDFRGPAERVAKEVKDYGYGLNVGVLNGIYPGCGISNIEGSEKEIEEYIEESLEKGALGVKILGGHFPITPETAKMVIRKSYDARAYVAYHAGSTENGSNINGMREAIEVANGLPLHIAHINSYCRGLIQDPLSEVSRALELLKNNPNIFSESYLSPLNGTSGDIDEEELPKSHVTRNCLKMFDYEPTKEGLGKALKDGVCNLYERVGEEMILLDAEDGYKRWIDNGYKGNICFPVNSPIATINCVIEKDKERFIVDAISTDGGAIPRNVIVSSGMLLVKYGALSLKEFVQKSSYNPARMFGLIDKGHFSEGADADITVIDSKLNKVEKTIINGKIVLIDGYLIKEPGKILSTEKAVEFLEGIEAPYEIVDLEKSTYFLGR